MGIEKRRTADSFLVNKPSVSPETEYPIGQSHNCRQIIDWSVARLQAIKIVMRHKQLQTISNQAVKL